jgi:hypothetical protein
MFKILWKSFLASPAVLAAALAISSTASAAESVTKAEIAPSATSGIEFAQAQSDSTTLEQLENYSTEGQSATDSNDQVTSVNELKDVAPTDWAYEALRSLVERYGCIVGYPDQTYRGNRAMTRWEFAAGLNACMNTMERLIQENVAVLKEDVDKLKRLMQEFEAELAALGARVDNLEGRVAFLEDHQFSTTTKLQGEVIFALTDAFGDADDSQTIFGDRVRLVLNTSFTGEDRLVTRLAAGNMAAFGSSATNQVGPLEVDTQFGFSPTTTQTFNIGNTGNNDIVLDWLAYYYPLKLNDDFTINTYVAATGGIWSDIAPTSNPYFEDYDGGNGALSTFASENPIYRIGGGAGLGVSFDLGFVQVTGGYLAGGIPNPDPDGNPNTNDAKTEGLGANVPSEGSGLFNGDYAALAQLNFKPFDKLELGLTYVHAFHKAGNTIFAYGTETSLVGTNQVNNVAIGNDRITNSYGAQIAFRPVDFVSISGFFTYGDIQELGGGNVGTEYWTYGGGVSFPDLGKEGSVLGIFAGVQPYLGDRIGGNNRNPVHVEAFYKYQLTDNISITPGVIWITDPEQLNGSNDEIIGTLRTTFTF